MTRVARTALVRVVWFLIAAGALVFAVQGGEYSTLDLWRQHQRREQLLRGIDSVRRVVDSLRRYHERVQKDPRLQERLAREEFGMVRGDKELLYRFVKPPLDSGDTTRKR